MNPQHFGKRVKESLDQGLHVSPAIEGRLRAARTLALERQRTHEPVFAALLVGAGGLRLGGPSPAVVRYGLPLAIVVAGLIGLESYRDHQRVLAEEEEITQQAAEIEEIDAKVLTSDLPVKALLDEEFLEWLKKPAQPSQE